MNIAKMSKKIDTYGLMPMNIANWFISNIDREAGDSITHLKLQKLLYYSQVWAIVLNGKSLFEEDFQAWTHGPVLPSVYDSFRVRVLVLYQCLKKMIQQNLIPKY